MLLGVGLLSGCGNEPEARRDPADDARDVAAVERLSQPPFRPIRPEAFTSDDIDRYDLAREGCVFRPGNAVDGPPVFIAQKDRGYLKIEGRLQPLAPKEGSSELPSGAHATYIGTENWVELVAQAGDAGSAASASRNGWPSRLVIHDANERVAFDGLGQVNCTGSTAEG
ncbi:hypothetical protein ABVV53_11390 [Novosphingobium sp. RD2P27]|uniref:Lipoprotein n=1 Tax=Novosphingobium kalidii TaxID=3230299 RepID=A0ABV2D2G1_9SPHN